MCASTGLLSLLSEINEQESQKTIKKIQEEKRKDLIVFSRAHFLKSIKEATLKYLTKKKKKTEVLFNLISYSKERKIIKLPCNHAMSFGSFWSRIAKNNDRDGVANHIFPKQITGHVSKALVTNLVPGDLKTLAPTIILPT